MKTTIYINNRNLSRLESAAYLLQISRNELICMFISRLTYDNKFNSKLFKAITYQESNDNVIWMIKHIELEPVFYEKALDLRRHYKFSVSWLIAYAIENYLDDILEKLLCSENRTNIRDNYDRNYIYISQYFGEIPSFTVTWGFPEEKYHLKN